MTPEEKIERYKEIERRGLLSRLPPEKQEIWAEVKRRQGITVDGQQSDPEQAAPQQDPVSQQPAPVAQQPAPQAQQQPADGEQDSDGGVWDFARRYIPAAQAPAFVRDVYTRVSQGMGIGPAIAESYGRMPAVGALETGATMASGAGAEVIGGLRAIASGGGQEGAEAVEQTREAMTYMPRGQAGQDAMRTLGAVGKGIQAVENVTGEGAVEVGRVFGVDPNSKTAAGLYAAGASVPTAVGELLGVGLAKGGARAGRGVRQLDNRPRAVNSVLDNADDAGRALDDTAQRIDPEMPRQPEPVRQATPPEQLGKADNLRQAIQQGNREAAGYRIDQRGIVVPDRLANKVIQQGYSDATVASVKAASPADRTAMLKMLDVAERGMNNAGYRARFRPSDVIGDNVMQRWRVITDANKKARSDIRAASRQELRGKRVDVSDAVQGFIDDLDDIGVTFGDDGRPVFRGSQIEGNSATAPIKIIAERLKASDDGLALHNLKQYIDSQIDWKKPSDKPLDTKAVDALKRLRGRINERLGEVSGKYADANARASETFQVMDDMMDVMGARRFSPDAPNAPAYVGQEMRKILSNYQKRTDMIQAIDKLDEVATKYGGQFADDPVTQAVFFNDMERMFGSFADNSFQGGIEKGVGRAAQFAETGPVGKAVMAVEEGVNRARGINDQNAIARMRELLQRSSGN